MNENVNFIVEKVFKAEDVARNIKIDKNKNIPVMADESKKAKLEKKLLDAINAVNPVNDNGFNKDGPLKSEIDDNKINDPKVKISRSTNSAIHNLKVIDMNANKNFFMNNNNIPTNLNQQNPNFRSEQDPILKNLERVVHIDLKGAPPKPDYFKSFIPLLKEFGATGILLEYEDTFPFEGKLSEAKNGRAYTLNDIKMIKEIAKKSNLYIIPLVQTYGHLEWMLKVKAFAHLRESNQFPQVISPCLNETYTVLYGILILI